MSKENERQRGMKILVLLKMYIYRTHIRQLNIYIYNKVRKYKH